METVSSGMVLTSEEKALVDRWAGEVAAAMVSSVNATPPPLTLAQTAYSMAMKLLEVRRDIYRDR